VIKLYLGSFVLLTVGIVIGVFISKSTEVASIADSREPGVSADQARTGSLATRSDERLRNLEVELASVSARLKLIESRENPTSPGTGQIEDEDATTPESSISFFGGSREPVAVVEGLVAAGLDSHTAEQIARRVSESELKRLELRDRAIREGYIGSEQYREEMIALREEQVRVRDQIDGSTYDRYLYYSGQSNRVAVSSVMLGSAAETSGVKAGDVLLRYEESTLYKPGDIRGLTSQGEKDEAVNLTLLRDGEQMTVSVPRGPLGVRLSAIRINPDDD
jgi:hypothetical protein